jgi:hypothetical protein
VISAQSQQAAEPQNNSIPNNLQKRQAVGIRQLGLLNHQGKNAVGACTFQTAFVRVYFPAKYIPATVGTSSYNAPRQDVGLQTTPVEEMCVL